MKKKIAVLFCALMMGFMTTGCYETEASRVSYNLSQEADNFNVVRQVTVINCITGDVLLQATGKMSIESNVAKERLEIIAEVGNGQYTKDFIGISDNTTYVITQIESKDVNKYKYTINYNPKMWIPVEGDIVD